jgi:hypothetical protein
MTDPRQEDRERLASEPVRANHSDEVCLGCGKRILVGEVVKDHRGESVHGEGTCAEALDEKLAAANAGKPPLASSILVCGSRSWTDADRVKDALERLWPGIVIEGGTPGADRLGRQAANALGIHVATVPARWKQLRAGAGEARNSAMLLLKPDLVLAFWDGSSPGTRNMIRLAESAGVPVEVIRP